MIEQAAKYQKNINVKEKQPGEFKSIQQIFGLLPKELKILDIAAAEGYLVYRARKMGFCADGIEIDPRRTERGQKHFNIKLQTGDIFENFYILEKYDVFVLSRFFHNVGAEKSAELMDEIDKKSDYILIIKYKPGLLKENKRKRKPLSTRKGLNSFLGKYELDNKAFTQQVIVATKGKYRYLLKKLRLHLKEG